MPSIGTFELIAVLVVALAVLGPKRLPDLGRALGAGVREFKDAIIGDANAGRAISPSEQRGDAPGRSRG